MNAEIPTRLPVSHLSVSSVRTFLECPERWRRRYLLGEFEPAIPAMLLGTAVHRAEGASYQRVIDGQARLTSEEVLDVFVDEFLLEVERAPDVDWEDEKPGRVKDTGVRVVEHYHRLVAPRVQPVSVERHYDLAFEGLDWTFKGYLDLEQRQLRRAMEHGHRTHELIEEIVVADLKVRSPKRGLVSAGEAAEDLQPTGNLFARRAEGQPPSEFAFHNLLRPAAKGTALTHKHVSITPAHRTDAELDAFGRLLMSVAAEIAWRTENDWWRGPAQSWRCSERFCGYWGSCDYGGGLRTIMPVPGPTVPIAPSGGAYLDAVAATQTKTGARATTAPKVAAYLGVTTREASAKLTALARAGRLESEQPTKASGRGKDRVVTPTRGPRLYRIATVEAAAA